MGATHLLTIDDLSAADIDELMRLTDSFVEVSERRIPKVPALRGRTVAFLFYEDSTRTRLSFETAAKRLSADTMNFSVGSSSVSKGESLRDTVQTIQAMGVDGIVLRHKSAGAPKLITQWTDGSVINAGDGWHAHPTQALLDTYTLRQQRGSLTGMRIAIVGDIKHSRVARSNAAAFTKMGAKVTFVAPKTLLPSSLEPWDVTVAHSIDDVIDEVDVLYMLRMQMERQERSPVPSLREYTRQFGLTAQRFQRLNDDVLVMHPGPMNRGVEIAADVPDSVNGLVTDQVRNGVAVRMAVLFKLFSTTSDPSFSKPTIAAPAGA
ncbi:MAG: aspartate carbamoyltransferase catalytic subunit [Acidimicrobiales bacterium]